LNFIRFLSAQLSSLSREERDISG